MSEIVRFSDNGKTLIAVSKELGGEYIIPSGVEEISSWAFSGCSGLTSVTIPESVTSIGDRAFYRCASLISVYISNGTRFKYANMLSSELLDKIVEKADV